MKRYYHHPIYVVPQRLSKEYCESIIEDGLQLQKENSQEAQWGTEATNSEFVGGHSLLTWFAKNDSIHGIFYKYAKEANESCWNLDVEYKGGIAQFAQYEVGDFQGWHLDNPSIGKQIDDEENIYKLAVTINLSDPDTYEGGNLHLMNENCEFATSMIPDHDKLRLQGTIMVFPSYIIHAITPVTKGIRYSATNWCSGPHFR